MIFANVIKSFFFQKIAIISHSIALRGGGCKIHSIDQICQIELNCIKKQKKNINKKNCF